MHGMTLFPSTSATAFTRAATRYTGWGRHPAAGNVPLPGQGGCALCAGGQQWAGGLGRH